MWLPLKMQKNITTRGFNPLCAFTILCPFAIAHNGLKPVVIKKVNKILDGVVFLFPFFIRQRRTASKKERFFGSFLSPKKNGRFKYLVK